jgi:hypothetical protein
LKEGWPDHSLIIIQILIPAGVVDCLFKFRIFSSNVLCLIICNPGSLNINLIRKNE